MSIVSIPDMYRALKLGRHLPIRIEHTETASNFKNQPHQILRIQKLTCLSSVCFQKSIQIAGENFVSFQIHTDRR